MATFNTERQYPLYHVVSFTYADLVTAVAEQMAEVPANAIIVSGSLVVDTVWNTTGAATAGVGDGASTTRYLAATTLKTAGRTALVPTGFKYTANDTIDLLVSLADTAATTGAARLLLEYIIDGRGNENQG